MTTPAELEVKIEKLPTNLDRLDGIVNGPSSGPTSLVTVDSGSVKTLARLAEEGQVEVDDAAAFATQAETARDAAIAAAGNAMAALPTEVWIGNPGPAVGTTAGNISYITDMVAYVDMTLVSVKINAIATGNIKIKVFDDLTSTWSGTAGATIPVIATGLQELTCSVALKAGQRAAIWGQGIISTTASGGALSPYYTLSGDVLTGAKGSRVTNQSLNVGYKFRYGDEEDSATTQAIALVTGETKKPHLGLADADLGSSLSTTSAYWDPRFLRPGPVRSLSLYGRTAGWITMILSKRWGSTQFFSYKLVPLYIDVGKTTYTVGGNVLGKSLPRDFKIEPETIVGFLCPSGGGQIAYTNVDGPNISGENLIGYRLPNGNFSGMAAYGPQTLTWSATSDRQFAMEWDIHQEQSPRKMRPAPKILLRELFDGTSLPTNLTVTSTAPTFTAGHALSNAVGFTNNMRSRRGNAFHKFAREIHQGFGAASSVIANGTRPMSAGYGSAVTIDQVANTWSVHEGHTPASSTPPVKTTRAWPGTFSVANSRLVTRWERYGRLFRVTLTDYGVQPIVEDYYEVDAREANIPPTIPSNSENLGYMGMQVGYTQSLATAGKVDTLKMVDYLLQRAPSGLIVGDSITNGSRVAEYDGWAYQVENERFDLTGEETAICAVDGWSMTDGHTCLKNVLDDLPELEWCIIALGTNRGSVGDDVRDKRMFEAAAMASLFDLLARGIKPYFLVPVAHPYSPGVTTGAERLAFLQTLVPLGATLIRGDLALTQANGTTFEPTSFHANGVSDVHPNKPGHQKIKRRVYLDAPEIFL